MLYIAAGHATGPGMQSGLEYTEDFMDLWLKGYNRASANSLHASVDLCMHACMHAKLLFCIFHTLLACVTVYLDLSGAVTFEVLIRLAIYIRNFLIATDWYR